MYGYVIVSLGTGGGWGEGGGRLGGVGECLCCVCAGHRPC